MRFTIISGMFSENLSFIQICYSFETIYLKLLVLVYLYRSTLTACLHPA